MCYCWVPLKNRYSWDKRAFSSRLTYLYSQKENVINFSYKCFILWGGNTCNQFLIQSKYKQIPLRLKLTRCIILNRNHKLINLSNKYAQVGVPDVYTCSFHRLADTETLILSSSLRTLRLTQHRLRRKIVGGIKRYTSRP